MGTQADRHPARGAAVTTITGHSQALLCALCGTASTVRGGDYHHIVHRSMGGLHDPAVYLCRTCHDALHAEKHGGATWRGLYIPGEGGTGTFKAVDRDGHTIVERPAWHVMTEDGPLEQPPPHWDAGAFLQALDSAPDALMLLSGSFRLLHDDELVAAGEALGKVSHVAWQLRARLFRLALLRSPWGQKGALLIDLARRFGLGHAAAYREAALIAWVDEHPIVYSVDDLLPPVAALTVISRADDPVAAAALWEERAAEGDTNVRRFKAEVAGDTEEWCACPTCGTRVPKGRLDMGNP